MATKVDPEEAIVPINSEIHRNNYHHTVQNDNCSNQTNNGKVAEGLSNKGFSLNAETEKQGSLHDESLKDGCNSNDADYDNCDNQLQGDITFCPTNAELDKHNLVDKSDVPNHKPSEQNTIKNNKITQQKEPKSPNDVITDQVDEKKPLLQPPTCSENTGERLPTCRLIITSMKLVLWIGLSALPTIIIVCMAGFGYSHLKWTRKILNNGTTTDDGGINYYFNRWTVFWFDDVMRTFLITLLNVIVACVLYNLSMRKTLYLIVSVALPITLTGSFCFYCMLEWYTSDPYAVWFYYIDIVIFMMAFFLVVPLAQLLTAKQVGAKLFKVTKLYILPMFLMALGIAFVDIYFSKTYRVEKDGSLLKYSQRLIVYPVLMDSFLSLGEFFVRRLEGTTVRGEAHSLYLIQVRFGILGRYMNLTAGNLTMLTITCSLVMLKDVVLHRMGRIQCWMFYKIKELDKIRRFFKREQSSTEEFRAWYFEERFCNFRACVLNNDLLHEFTATIVTPILLVFFRPHRLLFRFDDDLFINTKSGLFEPGLFYAQFFIQIGFLFITYVFIVFIEGRFNGVHLRYAFAQRNLLQEISQIVIYLWGMLQILSAVRVIPNYFQCDTPNICSCHFNINKTEYGC